MDLKDFKALVKYCREAGIYQYKSPQVEFTLSPDDPQEKTKTQKKLAQAVEKAEEIIQEMSEEDLLLYSAGQGDVSA